MPACKRFAITFLFLLSAIVPAINCGKGPSCSLHYSYNEHTCFSCATQPDSLVTGGQSVGIVTGRESAAVTLTYSVTDATQLKVTYTDGTVTVAGPDGVASAEVQTAGAGITIADSQGNLFAADEKGKVTLIGKMAATAGDEEKPRGYDQNAASLNRLDSEIKVYFENNDDWALDERKPAYAGSHFDSEYENLGGYYVPWKFIPAGSYGKVSARLEGNLPAGARLVFRTPAGTEYFSKKAGNRYELTIAAASARDAIEVYALVAEGDSVTRSAGKIRAASYPLLEHSVVLVPMDDGLKLDATAIKRQLDAIYRPYGISWNVRVDDVFSDRSWDTDKNGLQSTGSEFYSVFTAEMRALNSAYIQQRGLDGVSVYLFVFRQAGEGSQALLGDMPLESRFGYIFNYSSGDKTWLTIAHELGHGIFQLRHPFSEKYGLKQGTTDNLMDYTPDGLALKKYQWDIIHDPQNRLFAWAEGEEEGEMIEEPLFTFEWKTPPSSGIVTYITPSGLPISIKDAASCFVATEDNAGFSLDNDGVFDDTPEGKIFSFYTDKGPLFGFEKDNKKWFAIFSKSYFYGYYNKESKEYYTETTTENITASPYITYVWESTGWTAKHCCLKITEYESIKLQNTPDYKGAGYFETDAINRPEATCIVPKAIEQLTEASFSELYVGEVWAKYNYFGDGGILYKVTLKGTNGYLYQNKDNAGNEYWLVYDKNAKHWKKFNYPGFRATDLLNLDFIGKIAQETGHTALDIIGVIPVIGEGADFINGLWYIIEGDALNASLCYASMIPVIGDAVFKGTKVVIKSIKSAGKAADIAKGLDKAINLTGQTSEIFVKIGKSLNAKSVPNINECLYETGVLLTKHSDKAADLEKLLNAVQTEKLHAVLKKLNALEGGKCGEFISDAVKVDGRISPAGNLLVNNLDKIDDGIIEAWQVLDGSPLIRLEIGNLQNLRTVIKHPNYSFTFEQLITLGENIKKSGSQKRLIEQLKYATKYEDFSDVTSILKLSDVGPISPVKIRPGTNGKIAIIGRNMKYIKVYADELIAQGKEVKIFDGDEISLAAREELKNAIKDGVKLDASSILYRENEAWITKLKADGYEIQDIGNPNSVIDASIFYDMEKRIVFE